MCVATDASRGWLPVQPLIREEVRMQGFIYLFIFVSVYVCVVAHLGVCPGRV